MIAALFRKHLFSFGDPKSKTSAIGPSFTVMTKIGSQVLLAAPQNAFRNRIITQLFYKFPPFNRGISVFD